MKLTWTGVQESLLRFRFARAQRKPIEDAEDRIIHDLLNSLTEVGKTVHRESGDHFVDHQPRCIDISASILTSIVELPRHYEEIATRVKKAVHDEFEQYGLQLLDLLIEAVTLPDEVQKAIDRAAGSRAVGADELDRYERTARSDALRDSAKQPGAIAGSGLAAGVGMGAGMQMAHDMARTGESGRAPAKLTMDQVRAKLRELKTLVDEGLITQKDFEEQKKRLLDQT